MLRYLVGLEPVASHRRELLLFSIHTNGQRVGESAQRKLLALAVRWGLSGIVDGKAMARQQLRSGHSFVAHGLIYS